MLTHSSQTRAKGVNLLVTCPYEVKLSLIAGIQRWQHRRLLQHIPTATGAANVWHRALRGGLSSVSDPRQLGALSAVWGNICPLPAARAAQGYEVSPHCLVCQPPEATYGHVWYLCQGLILDGMDYEGREVPEKFLGHREALINSSLDVCAHPRLIPHT